MNPYASWLAGQDPLPVIDATPAKLEAELGRIGRSKFAEPWAPGKWSINEVLAHLADTEIVFAVRLRHTIAEDGHVIQPFDQDAWAATYKSTNAAQALAVFSAVRQWNAAFIRAQRQEAFDKVVTHPERGTMTFRTIVETMAGHDLNHLDQLRQAR